MAIYFGCFNSDWKGSQYGRRRLHSFLDSRTHQIRNSLTPSQKEYESRWLTPHLSRLRLNIEVKPTPWFSTFVQAQDAEAGGIQPKHVTSSIKDVFDLRQGYLEFRSDEKGWFRLRIGRQEFRYGQERLIGVSDGTNVTRVFDALRLVVGTEKGSCRRVQFRCYRRLPYKL